LLGNLLWLLLRPREGDPRRCTSVDILAREILGGFLRCFFVGRCSSVDILAREIPRRLESSPRCAEATATPFPSFLGPLNSLAADYLCPIGSLSLAAVTAPPIPTVLTLRNPGHRDCRLRLFAAPLVSLLSDI
ncbi:hypothetical protein Taro_011587, partial [Colocasia esculenta]|nr:hypothetical protein [Colocasia esculenta]